MLLSVDGRIALFEFKQCQGVCWHAWPPASQYMLTSLECAKLRGWPKVLSIYASPLRCSLLTVPRDLTDKLWDRYAIFRFHLSSHVLLFYGPHCPTDLPHLDIVHLSSRVTVFWLSCLLPWLVLTKIILALCLTVFGGTSRHLLSYLRQGAPT